MLKYIQILVAISVFILSHNTIAQEKNYSAKEALVIFKDGNYAEAQIAYESLLNKSSRDIKYNYYYGICLLQNNHNIPQAVKSLKYASVKGVSRDAYYYLGRAYQLSYQFEEAIAQYNRFLKYASASDIRNDKAEKYKEECEIGRSLSAKIYNLDVYRRDSIAKEDLLRAYTPAKDVGKIIHNSDFFESGVDPNGILYQTERGDEVYFSLIKEVQEGNLYKMEKLLDGWSESQPLGALNSTFDDIHPYVLIDGSTIFFSSNRDGGIGGYDLYKANYDTESKQFSEPVNLGIPFNSPKDDYLFVADEFNNMAWFASNRETNDSTLIVYTIRWDNSVVKNLVQDMNQVKEEAALLLSENSPLNNNNNNNKNGTSKQQKQEALFHFMVADTLEYSQLEHFKSSEARSMFEQGLKLDHQKDSLSNLMARKRESYARTNSETERSMLVNDILLLEKQVYGIDAKIERNFYKARSIEQETVRQMVLNGTYTAPSHVKKEKKHKTSFENILIPSNYTYYTDDEFARQLEELEKMYAMIFSEEEIKKLNHADSLYVWGNILTLEASKLLEEANDEPEQTESLVNNVLRKKDSLAEEVTVESIVKQAKELKHTALKLYHESLNGKFNVYSHRMKQIIVGNSVDDLSFIEQAQSEGFEYFRESEELTDPIYGFDVERYERAGALKRSGVQAQEKGFFEYVDFEPSAINNEPNSVVIKTNVPKTYQELQGAEVTKKEPSKVVAEAFSQPAKSKLIYKIQIGVFKNEPNAQAVAQIPSISSVEIPERGLTKYFAGEYSSYADAYSNLESVKNAGFSGAFVVVFEDGKQINLTEELKQ